MMTRDLMLKDVVTLNGNVSVKETVELLFKRHIGSVIVVDAEQRCVGIFTERDAIRIIAQDVPLGAPLEKVMTKNPFTVREDSTFEEAKNIIVTHKIRHLPVINADGKLVGLISVRKILDALGGL
jgi:CBS domain-containing protein